MTDARATWWCQATEGVNYVRAVLPARYLPGKVMQRDHYLAKLDEGRLEFPEQEGGTAIWMWPGNAVKGVLIAQMMAQGYRCLVEVDDNYFTAPPIDFGAWRKDEVNGHEHSYESHRQIVPLTDGVIAATPKLGRVYGKLHDRVFVCPNMVDPNDWPELPFHQDGGVLSVGWAASDSHAVDAHLIEPALEWASRQDGVKVVIVGIEMWKPKFPHFHVPYAPMKNYRLHLHQHIDVMLCPLVPGRWSDCKSDVKCLEAAMSGACSVVSREEPYRPWFKGPAMVASDARGFLSAVKHLVTHRDEVRDMAEKARQYVLNERSIQGQVWRWEEACAEVALAA